jgi:NAD(P)-dependent dehydrogenase (short-subunit alcohol dehydrogenase family)
MSEKFLQNKVAIVTGGSRGIGKAIATSLINAGARVVICGARQKSVDDAVTALTPHGASAQAESIAPVAQVHGIAADVSKLDDVRALIHAAKEKYGTIDILVNNAGIGVFRNVADLTPAEWQRMIGINLTGAYYCCHEVLPIFRQTGGGDIVNISSLAGKNPFAGGAGYNASKFGLNGFSDAMMLDHRNNGVRVTTVMPGSVDTEFGGNSSESKSNWKIAPEDVAEIVLTVLRMPRRTTISQVEVRPSRPPQKG